MSCDVLLGAPALLVFVHCKQRDSAMQKDEKGFRAKISDFGLSQHMTKDQEFVLVSKGSEAYLPAEVFRHLKLTEKSDVYSLGLVMWEIFYGIFWHAIHTVEKRKRGCAACLSCAPVSYTHLTLPTKA